MHEMKGHFEVVVVGGGPAGISAACVAAESGKRVALIDETPWLGGQIWRGEQARSANRQAQQWLKRFGECGAALLDRTSVIGSTAPGVLMLAGPAGPGEIRWDRLILATGARELFLPLPGWTLPGVFGPGGLQVLVKNGWPIERKRVVIAGSGPLLLAVGDGLRKQGAQVVSVNEQAPTARVAGFAASLLRFPGKLFQAAAIRSRLLGTPVRFGTWPVQVAGDERVERVVLTDGRQTWSEDCDVFACGFGMVPNIELPMLLGCELAGDFVKAGVWQDTSVPDIFVAGEPAGVGGADCALVEGRIAGYAAAEKHDRARSLFSERASWHKFRGELARSFALRSELKSLAADETLVCRCEYVPFGQIRRYSGFREAKLQSRCGMGTCQGRVCGSALAFLLGWRNDSVRPPLFPSPVASLTTLTTHCSTPVPAVSTVHSKPLTPAPGSNP